MAAPTKLPGVDAAQDLLGFSLDEVARSMQVEYSTLYRWRNGRTPGAVYKDRLEHLEELANYLVHALGAAEARSWLDLPSYVFSGRTPREMLLEGRTEMVLGSVVTAERILRSLANNDAATEDQSLAATAAMSLVESDLKALVARMQTAESEEAVDRMFEARPRVRIP
ncbi:MAG: hypothetical protein AVDCRST_MAG89-5075 [uncultured Gemmatimonadetes bacterium]|uniref:Antitoxin Xre/MbcA/ParS-like toxin-binding domain-containing protein n=1 Tax=uncultured Gemmatimonadota bacterium TaxID=203437 RepID=A0A6J4N9T4_9BACT|nr:MAG: hypothetical protein AVDCRST_MAG89-5075 [uncultured Gemmatimonadota bacterium]